MNPTISRAARRQADEQRTARWQRAGGLGFIAMLSIFAVALATFAMLDWRDDPRYWAASVMSVIGAAMFWWITILLTTQLSVQWRALTRNAVSWFFSMALWILALGMIVTPGAWLEFDAAKSDFRIGAQFLEAGLRIGFGFAAAVQLYRYLQTWLPERVLGWQARLVVFHIICLFPQRLLIKPLIIGDNDPGVLVLTIFNAIPLWVLAAPVLAIMFIGYISVWLPLAIGIGLTIFIAHKVLWWVFQAIVTSYPNPATLRPTRTPATIPESEAVNSE